jgi:hypothetical protein
MSPPAIARAASYESIAIGGFAGQYGQQVSREVEASLQAASVAGRKTTRVVPKEDVYALTGGRQLNTQLAGEVATRLRVDALIFGEVTYANAQDTTRAESEQECTSRKQESNDLKRLLGLNCTDWRTVQYQCRDRVAQVQIFVRVFDAQRRELVYSQEVVGSAQSSGCKDTQPESANSLVGLAKARAVPQIRALLSFRESRIRVPILQPEDGMSAAIRSRLEGAIEFATAGRLDRACEVFYQVFDTEKQSPNLTYNTGICEENSGNSWKAHELFQTADQLSRRPNAAITAALDRTKLTLSGEQSIATARPEFARSVGLRGNTAPVSPATPARVAAATPIGNSGEVPLEYRIAALTEKRLALIIGNANYRQGALRNPVNDATDMAATLQSLGFQVITVTNGSQEKMMMAIEEFGRRAPENGVALFFYAGHAVQVKGENFLIPIEASIQSEEEVPFRSVNVGLVLAKLEAAKTRMSIVVLDACRDNPFARSFRSQAQGLAAIDAPGGTLIAYATSPGKTAADGAGRNGLYTSHLLRQLARPNLKVEDVFKGVRAGVQTDSGRNQVPWEASSLTGDFYFNLASSIR